MPAAFETLALLNPHLTSLRLDFCGRIDCNVMEAWSSAFPNLKRLELLGPFLVRVPAWLIFIKAHPKLEGFLLTQSPRFDLDCMQTLASTCKGLTELRLREVGKMDDDFLKCVSQLGKLEYLEISYPGVPEALSEEALIDLLSSVGKDLAHLDLSNNINITDNVLLHGVKTFCRNLSTLAIAHAPDLTDAGVAEFFDTWVDVDDKKKGRKKVTEEPNPPLSRIDLSRCHELSTAALEAILNHSGELMTSLNINGWKATSQDALKSIASHCPELTQLDMGWCREVDDWIVKDLMEKCEKLRDLRVWGCQRVTSNCPRRVSYSVVCYASRN